VNVTTSAYAAPATLLGTALPPVRSLPLKRSLFGDIVLLAFLLSQCLDGVFTYVGVITFGSAIEANPLIATLMTHFGDGAAVLGAKSVAALLGIGLHLQRVHGAVALLAAFYVIVAILPWVAIFAGVGG
jgi:hypothetical protein